MEKLDIILILNYYLYQTDLEKSNYHKTVDKSKSYYLNKFCWYGYGKPRIRFSFSMGESHTL